MNNSAGKLNVAGIEEAIFMLNTNVESERIKSFVAILEALKNEPENESLLTQLFDAFQNLGITQGAVLTYAPSIYDVVVGDPFGEETRR